MAAPRRVAELRPKLLGGRALPAARSMRLRVTDTGAVALTDVSGQERQLLAPGAVARALLVGYDDAERFLPGRAGSDELLVLLDGTGTPLLALGLLDWAPPAYSTGAEWREVTGAPAFVAALGLPLEPAEARDLEALEGVSEVLLRPLPEPPWPGRHGVLLSSVALALALVGGADPNSWFIAVFTALSILVVAPVVVAGSRARAEARAPGPTPGRDARTVIRPRPEGRVVRGLAEATLEIGTDEVVLTDRGREVWLPGPARGGVARAVVAPETVQLTDLAGNDYGTLAAELWAPTDQAREDLARDLSVAGLDASLVPVARRLSVGVAGPHGAKLEPSSHLSNAERGDATTGTPWLSGCAAALAVGTSAMTVSWNAPVGAVLLVAALALLGLRVHDTVRRSVADRRAMRRVEAVPVAALR